MWGQVGLGADDFDPSDSDPDQPKQANHHHGRAQRPTPEPEPNTDPAQPLFYNDEELVEEDDDGEEQGERSKRRRRRKKRKGKGESEEPPQAQQAQQLQQPQQPQQPQRRKRGEEVDERRAETKGSGQAALPRGNAQRSNGRRTQSSEQPDKSEGVPVVASSSANGVARDLVEGRGSSAGAAQQRPKNRFTEAERATAQSVEGANKPPQHPPPSQPGGQGSHSKRGGQQGRPPPPPAELNARPRRYDLLSLRDIANREPSWGAVAVVLAFVVVVCVVALLSPLFAGDLEDLANGIDSLGVGGRVLYVLVLALWTFAFLPNLPIVLGAGFFFPFGAAFLVSLAGTMLGAYLSYFVARRVLTERAHFHFYHRFVWLAAVEVMADQRPWQTTLLLKLSCVPSGLKNCGIGTVPGVLDRHFLGATLVSNSLSSLVWCLMGNQADDLKDAIERSDHSDLQVGLLVLGVVFLLAFLAMGALATRRLYHQVRLATRQLEENEHLGIV